MITGPNIVTNGLVFGYDADDRSKRFYPGEPVTNLFLTPGGVSTIDQDVTFSVNGNGTFIRLGYGQKYGGYIIKSTDAVYKYNLGANGCHYHGNDVSITAGQTVTMTFDYYLSPNVVIETDYLGNFEGADGTAGGFYGYSNEVGKWSTFTTTRTATSSGTLRMLLYPGGCGGRLSATGYILFKNPICTVTNHPVQFCEGTRSSTQGLIDLKKTTNINLSNISFDSTAHPVFDGTDDYITIPNSSVINISDNVTVEIIYKRLVTDPVLDIIAQKYSNGWELYQDVNGYIYFGGRNGDGTYYSCKSPLTYSNNNYYHIVGIKTGLYWKLYINGELVNTVTANSIGDLSSSANLSIGMEGSAYYPNMKLPVFKIYNKALTNSEILQNYNANKKRFI